MVVELDIEENCRGVTKLQYIVVGRLLRRGNSSMMIMIGRALVTAGLQVDTFERGVFHFLLNSLEDQSNFMAMGALDL